MEGDADPFDFDLAKNLGMTVEHMRDTISNVEYLQWRAYYVWRNAMEELEMQEVKAKR